MSTLAIVGETAKRIERRQMRPPYEKVNIARKGTPAFEDAIYETNALFVKQEQGDVANLNQRFAIAERINPYANRQAPSTEINSTEDLKTAISDSLSNNTADKPSFNVDRAEVWIIHGKEREGAVTKLTAGLPLIPTAASYPLSVHRGGLSIVIGRRTLVIPVYSWLDYDLGSQIGLWVDEPENRMFSITVPEGYENWVGRTMSVQDDKEFETAVWNSFKSKFQANGMRVSNDRHEPNGPTTFPDWSANFDGVEYAVEITRLERDMRYPRLVDTVKGTATPVTDKNDHRLNDPISRAKVSEQEIRLSIKASLFDKAQKVQELKPNQRYILLMVSEWLPIEGDFIVWQNQSYSAFNYVFVARYDVRERLIFDTVYPGN